MNPWMKKPFAVAAILTAAVALSGEYNTDAKAQDIDIDKAVEKITRVNKAIARSEQKIQEASDETRDLLQQYRSVEKRSQALRAYNAQLESLSRSQQHELSSLREQIDKVTEVSRQITPLTLRMIEALEQFIDLDIPFLMEERRSRVSTLRNMMNRPDVDESEKYRRVLEAYQIENEYGSTIEAYRGVLAVGNKQRTVDFLRVGRIALVYLTLDGQEAGTWDRESRSWRKLPQLYLRSLPGALRIARRQAAPNLIRVPVPAPARSK